MFGKCSYRINILFLFQQIHNETDIYKLSQVWESISRISRVESKTFINKHKGGSKYPAGFMMNPLLAAANVIRHFAQNQTYHLTINKLTSEVLPEKVNRQTTIYNMPNRRKMGAPKITTQSSEKFWRYFSRRDKTITNKRKNLALHPSTSVIS